MIRKIIYLAPIKKQLMVLGLLSVAIITNAASPANDSFPGSSRIWGGVSMGAANIGADRNTTSMGFPDDALLLTDQFSNRNFHQTTGFIGVEAGYDRLLGNGTVVLGVGAEATLPFGNVQRTQTPPFDGVPGGSVFRQDNTNNWSVSALARAGLQATSSTQLFVEAGPTAGGWTLNDEEIFVSYHTNTASCNSTLLGGTAKAGIEHQVGRNLSVGGQVSYTKYQSKTCTSEGVDSDGFPSGTIVTTKYSPDTAAVSLFVHATGCGG